MIKYSIIIPHYNSPQLLVRCLNSIPVNEDVQVIVVDDCSPGAERFLETLPELSRPYLEFYSTDTNGGGGKARNVGLKHARGRWIVFADADDYFLDGFLNKWNQYSDSDNDIVFFDIHTLDENGNRLTSNKDTIYKLYEKRRDDRIFRYNYTEPWGKLFKRSLIEENSITFEESIVANDYLFSVKTGYYAKKITISTDCFYCYIVMKKSTSHGVVGSPEKRIARLTENVKVQQFLDSKGIKADINILSYVTYLKAFFPILHSDEIRVFKTMNYPCWPVLKGRIKLLIRYCLKRGTQLDSNTRVFL